MNSYNKILILHALDDSTSFLSRFRNEFNGVYYSFNSSQDSIFKAKSLLGELEPKSLIIYLGHGSSYGLYEPENSHSYDKYFLDVSWGNHYFEEHDVFLLSCKSNEYLSKIYKSNYSLGFGNIISSKFELDLHNKNNKNNLPLNELEIKLFNEIYVDCSVKVIKSLIENKVCFFDAPKYLRFFINKEINKILLDKSNVNRIYISRLLFDFRNQMSLKKNLL